VLSAVTDVTVLMVLKAFQTAAFSRWQRHTHTTLPLWL
jgi:hypothetical protein